MKFNCDDGTVEVDGVKYSQVRYTNCSDCDMHVNCTAQIVPLSVGCVSGHGKMLVKQAAVSPNGGDI